MSEPTVLAGDLGDDLRSYFALTTSTGLPRRITEMSARTLPTRRSPVTAWFAATAGLLATAAVLLLVGTHLVPHGGAGSSVFSTAAGNAALAPADRAPSQLATISYPGVDTTALADRGVRLLLPTGHGTAVLTPTQAQAAAGARAGTSAGMPGPAVLAFAELPDQPQPNSCLCWAVDVPVGAGVVQSSPGAPSLRTELVLIDAVTGRIVAVLSGHGIP